MSEPVLNVENLCLLLGDKKLLENISFSVDKGELVALIGMSGAGKTMLCRSLLGIAPKAAHLEYDNLTKPNPQSMSMVMQDAMTALDPAMPVGKQITEGTNFTLDDAARLAKELGLDDPKTQLKLYPSQLSGGMRQRIAIAVALATNPRLIFADEPTSSLDNDLRQSIMKLLKDICVREQKAMLFVTHDFGLVKEFASCVLIIDAGRMVACGKPQIILKNTQHGAVMSNAYIQSLINSANMAAPTNHTHGQLHYHNTLLHGHAHVHGRSHSHEDLQGCSRGHDHAQGNPYGQEHTHDHLHDHGLAQAYKPSEKSSAKKPLLQANAISKVYTLGIGKSKVALARLDFKLYANEICGLCGPSGVGKSTLARILAGLEKPSTGAVIASSQLNIQMIFQDSKSALNPRLTVEKLIGEPLYLQNKQKPQREKIIELLSEVELDKEHLARHPFELSGGQRQRVAIARAIATHPDLIIADEPVSSLDTTTTSKIVHLLKNLKENYNMALLLISHDKQLLAHVSDEIIELSN